MNRWSRDREYMGELGRALDAEDDESGCDDGEAGDDDVGPRVDGCEWGSLRPLELSQRALEIICPRGPPARALLNRASYSPTGVQFMGTTGELESLLTWLRDEEARETDEEIAAELGSAAEEVRVWLAWPASPSCSA